MDLILPGATAQPQTLAQASLLAAQHGGAAPSVVQMFWSAQEGLRSPGVPKYTNFPVAIAEALWQRGQLYLHTWAPYDWVAGKAWPAAEILAGKYDDYWSAQAATVGAWKRPLFVRFMHEFNLGSTKWFYGPADFVRVWEHVTALFKGVPNVTWVWGCNQLEPAGSALPGAADKLEAYMVDGSNVWPAFDAYNKSTGGATHWQTFAQVCDLTYATIDRLYPGKPMLLAEYGCSSSNGNQAAWITDALAVLPRRYPSVRGALYYGLAGTDLALTSAAGLTYAVGLKSGPYASAFPMPPDGQPIEPLQASWGTDPRVAQLDLANQTLSGQNTELGAAALVDAASIAVLHRKIEDAAAVATAQAEELTALSGHFRALMDNASGAA